MTLSEPRESPTTSLAELALLFLRLGLTAFGGPAVHIAMLEEEAVRRRRWLTHEQFLDLLGATNLIPGPNSTEMAIHLGYLRAGWAGLALAGICFILPAALLVTGIAWVYVHFGGLPQVQGILYGVKPVVIAVILQALWKLGSAGAKTRFLAVVGLVAASLSLAGASPLPILFGAGALLLGARWAAHPEERDAKAAWILAGIVSVLIVAPLALAARGEGSQPFALRPLFWFFVKIGSVLYGSGYVLLAFLRADLVTRWHWITSAQLLDATAVGQVTPGPVFTTATFIGYLLGGPWGAVVATIGIFLPGFVFVGLTGPLVPRLRRSPMTAAFLDGVNVSALGLMAAVTVQLGRAALVDPLTWALAAASALFLIRFRMNSSWLVLGAAVIGMAATVGRF